MNTSNSTILRFLGVLSLAGLLTACPEVPPPNPLEAAPVITQFTSSASTVSAGGRVTLSWKTEHATSVKVEDVRFGAVSGADTLEGSVEVGINDEALFVLTARNARGASDTAVVVVHVGAAAGELLLTALPDAIEAGQSVTIAWSAPGAPSVTLNAVPGGAVDLMGQTTSGSIIVNPTVNTRYTLTAGTRTSTTDVQVKPTLLSFSASSLNVDAGSTITLSWTTANATRVQLTAPGRGTVLDEMDAAKVASGSFSEALPAQVDPGQFFPYEITVTGAGVMLKDSLVISVNGNPGIVSFNAPARVRSATAGAFADGGVGPTSIRLTWRTVQASDVTLSTGGTQFYRAPSNSIGSGSLDLPTPATDTTYVITATGARGGIATSMQSVEVVGLPTVTLTATPNPVAGGTLSTFSWQGMNVRGIELSNPDGVVLADPMAGNMGSTQLFPATTALWSLRALNGVGDSVTTTTTVTVTNPLSLSVMDTGTLRSGQNVNVSWSVPGAMPSIVGLPHDRVDLRANSTGFDDISTTGIVCTFPTTGNIVSVIRPSFSTTFFGRQVGSRISVSRHGYLSFSDDVNGNNSTDEALPSAKLEPYTIAPYWESLTVASGVYYQVKTVGGAQVLIVQWNTTTAVFQTKIFASGQVDFEYLTLPSSPAGHAGVVGPNTSQTRIGVPAADAGVTFFGAVTSPATVRAITEGPLVGQLDMDGGRFIRVATSLDTVVTPGELSVSEVLPQSSVGLAGQWVELRNARAQALDLTGWTFGLADGGAIPLTTTLPARSLVLLGASTDRAQNDDAGVTTSLANFDLTGLGSFTFGRGGAHDIVPFASIDAGVAFAHDPGPFRGVTTTTCPATIPFGSQMPAQLGTPGRDTGCGFPYSLVPTRIGYLDISDGGRPLMTDKDDEIAVVDLTANPVPIFGVMRTSMQVSTNGFITFDSAAASASNYHSSSVPSASDSNLVLAVLADDLDESLATGVTGAQVYVKRVALNEDPFASAPHWVVEWHHYSPFSSASDIFDFEVKLFDDGVIEYHYGRLLSASSSAYGSGTSAVSWLENAAGTQALSINVNSTNPGLAPNSAFRFVPR